MTLRQNDIVLALDTADIGQAHRWVEQFAGHVGFFKVGHELFTQGGPELVQWILAQGEQVFLDLKFFDIPTTVRRAIQVAADWGVNLINVHGAGGPAMLQGAAEVQSQYPSLQILAVTILTSWNLQDVQALWPHEKDVSAAVQRLAQLAHQAGLAGVVCSPWEVPALKSCFGADFKTLCPGIRWADQAHDDQKRIMTPEAARAQKTDWMVVGRGLLQQPDPLQALQTLGLSYTAD